LYLDFVRDVICSGDVELFNYVIGWAAHLVQSPADLPGTALVLRGKEGTGKNKFVEPLMRIVGYDHALMLTSVSQVVGRFSGHLANKLLVFCNEGVWGGDKSAQGALKSMITENEQPVEYKGKDIERVNNYKRLVFATNEDWAVPRGEDDRRYVVIDVPDTRRRDNDFFAAIDDEMKRGGDHALMQYLLDIDLGAWAPRNIPDRLSQAGWDLKIMSGGTIVQWYWEMLQRGWVIKHNAYSEDAGETWPERLLMVDMFDSYLAYCQKMNAHHREPSCTVGRALAKWGIKTIRPRLDNPTRKQYYALPPLDDARAIFCAKFSIPDAVFALTD
jgi:hypothetical protein